MYSREIYLDPETEQRLRSYLTTELYNHRAERGDFLAQVEQEKKDYWAKPSEEVKMFPFQNACNIVIPLTAITMEAVHARVMTTLFAIPQFVSAKANLPELADTEQPYEKYMDLELQQNMRVREKIESPLLEIALHGTGIAKVGYERIVRNAMRELAGQEQKFQVVVKDGPTIDGVPINRFLMPFVAQDEQDAPWVGEEYSDTLYQVRLREQSGLFREGTTDSLIQFFLNSQAQQSTSGSSVDFTQAKLENREPILPQTLDWVALELGFDVDGDGQEEEIIVHFHELSQTFLSIRYNTYTDLRRSYRHANYFRVPYRWSGLGIGKQSEQFMREVTTQHRQRIDNATIANCRMIKVSKLSGYGPDEPIYPGKMWFLDDMSHVEPVQLGEVYNSAYNNESQTLLYNQQRTGINEVNLGMPQVGTPGTATADLARLQEGNKKFDYSYKNIRTWLDDLIIDTHCVIKQYGSKSYNSLSRSQEGQLVQSVFALPEEDIRSGFAMKLSTAGQNDNKLLDRNNWQMLFQMTQQYYQGMIQLAQMTGNQQLMMQIAQHAMQAGTEAMKNIYQTFDVPNVDRILLTKLFQQQMMGQVPIPNGPQQLPAKTGIGGIMPNGGNPGLPGIAAALSQFAGQRGV